MNFESLSETWFSGAAPAKAASRIEYRSATGPVLAPGITLCDEGTVIHGDGKIEFRRREDFGEREDFRPGSWSSACDTAQMEKLWDKLGDLGPESFPARVADPGECHWAVESALAGLVRTAKDIGKIAYRQSRHLDALAGVPILTGITYTEMAEFIV